MNNKKNNSNLKQILILVFFIIIIGIIGYISSNIDYTKEFVLMYMFIMFNLVLLLIMQLELAILQHNL